MGKYEITTGIRPKALRVVLYGVPGIGKTTMAAEFPSPIFIDVEDGSNQLPVARLPRPTSWAMLMDEVREVIVGNVPCSTLVIDTADAAEALCIDAVCSEHTLDGIEGAGYGKGYTYLAEKFGKLLDALGEVVDGGRNVVIVSHSMARKFERPDEEGAYDRYELKLTRKVAPMVKEWSDMLLFLDYKTFVETQSDKKGNIVKAKAKGGKRIIHTTHHPCWDAKNRFGLKDELPLSYDSIAHCVPDMIFNGGQTVYMQQPVMPQEQPQENQAPVGDVRQAGAPTQAPATTPTPTPNDETDRRIERMQAQLKNAGIANQPRQEDVPAHVRQLRDLMAINNISDAQLRKFVASKGWMLEECPIESYEPDFVKFLTGSWDRVNEAITGIPF